jgi:hypothetical protein
LVTTDYINVGKDLTVGGKTTFKTFGASDTIPATAWANPTTIVPGSASPDSNIIQFGDGTGWRLKFSSNPTSISGKTITDTGTYIYDNGNVNVGQNLTVGGKTTFKTFGASDTNPATAWANPTTIVPGSASPDSNIIQFGDGTGWRLKFSSNPASASGRTVTDTGTYIYDNGNVNVGKNLTVGKDLNVGGAICIGGTCINESHIRMLTGAQPIALNYNKGNGTSNVAAGNKTFVGACGFTVCGGVNMEATDDINRRSSFFIAPN